MSVAVSSPVVEALDAVRKDIDQAALSAGRTPGDVKLIAVSKTFSTQDIRSLLEAGHQDFGENRAQELSAKFAELGDGPRWHFVGRLQRNKVRQVVETGAVVHSVDRVELAHEISARAGHPVQILIEVNVSGEERKGGVEAAALPALTEAVLELPGLDLAGLMTMAPRTEDPELSRPFFRELARLRGELASRYSDRIHHLSMGMSQDYRVAVQEGATMVRVGEAIFGPCSPLRTFKAPDQMRESER